MKVTLRWVEEKVQEVEMTPLEYCDFHSGKTWDSYFPKDAIMTEYDDLSPEANNELYDFLYARYLEQEQSAD